MKRVFTGGKFYVEAGRFADAVLVEDGVIAAVGPDALVRGAAGSDCEVVDLGGRTVLPGFNDSHCHLYSVGVALTSLMMSDCTSIADCIETGREYIKKYNVPAGRFIGGRGWNQDYFTDEVRLLDRYDLDKISTEHPIVVRRACGHIASVNSKALEMAGVDENTPEVDGGEIRRDDNGVLTGIFSENAIKLFNCLEEELSTEQRADILAAAMAYANSHGITSVQTNDVKDDDCEASLAMYRYLNENGRATLRAYQQCCFTTLEGLKGFIAAGHKTGEGDDMNRIGPLKLFVDGSLGARTAVMRKPYSDDPSTTGVVCLSQELLDEMVRVGHEAGLQVATHAIGDGGIDMILSSYEKVIGDGPNTLRHGVVHCQITDIPLLQRFRDSDVMALVQPIFLHYDMKVVEDRVGAELAKTSYAWHTMDEMGIHVGYGTDSPVEDLGTMANLHCAVNRQDLKLQPPGGYNSDECVTLTQAIDNYTIGSAYVSFDETKKGRIQPGYLADMAVLDTDIFAIDPSEIINVKVDRTILGGETVYTRS